MSNRATRRAAERESSHHTADETANSSPISEAQLNANRENAQHSTGPRTQTGKEKSSMNAVKTGLTGRTVLLPSDDAVVYQQHVERHVARYTPESEEENELVQAIADTNWRLLRIAPLEASIWALGRIKLADLHADIEDPANREALLQGEIFSAYRKELSNIALQERRLRNQIKSDVADLNALKADRLKKDLDRSSNLRNAMDRANLILHNAKTQNIPFNFEDFGFEFSIEECLAYEQARPTYERLTHLPLKVDKFLAQYRKEKQTA